MTGRRLTSLMPGHDALLELELRCDADVTQDRACELGEEALDEVELQLGAACDWRVPSFP